MADPLNDRDALAAFAAGYDLPDPLAALLHRPAWMADAACREHPEVDFFPDRGDPIDAAVEVCAGCLVYDECREFALDQGDALHGVWAGLSQQARRRLRRLRREVRSGGQSVR